MKIIAYWLAIFTLVTLIGTYRHYHHRADPSPIASARCLDGTLSFSAHRQGTCSHHGGVAAWLNSGNGR